MQISRTSSAPQRPRRRLIRWLDAILAVTAVAAVAALILEYGQLDATDALAWVADYTPVLHAIQAAAVVVFVADRVARLVMAPKRWEYFQGNWVDFALMLAAGGMAVLASQMRTQVLSVGAVYVIITQGYIVAAVLVRGVSVNLKLAGSGLNPAMLLLGSFAFLCLFGSVLLMLPAAVQPRAYVHWDYVDSLFTATSATCVTGLVLQDTGADFTFFGQVVILVLIQLGALGIMLFGTVLAMLAGRRLSVRQHDAVGYMLGNESAGDIGRTARFVVLATLVFEAVGAVLLYPMFAASPDGTGAAMGPAKAVWHSVFHSISAFCNAGFALYEDNLMHGVRQQRWDTPLRDYWQVHGVIAPLIVIGGLGFPVLQDLDRGARTGLRRLQRLVGWTTVGHPARTAARPLLTLHSKIVLTSTALLLVAGMLVLLGTESIGAPVNPHEVSRLPGRAAHTGPGNVGEYRPGRDQPGAAVQLEVDPARRRRMGSLPIGARVSEAAFQSVTARTAGFNTVEIGTLTPAGKLWLCALMCIGGSPAGTAGGMKTVTLAVLIVAAASLLRRRDQSEAFGRTIAFEMLRRAVTVMLLYMTLVLVVTFVLSIALSPETPFIDVLFEACSACGTVGLSTGITGHLGRGAELAKGTLIAGMFVGRIGPLTLLLALTGRLRDVKYSYPSEDVIIG